MAFVVNRPQNEIVLVARAGVSFTRLPEFRAMVVIDSLDPGEPVFVKPRNSERQIPVDTSGRPQMTSPDSGGGGGGGGVMWLRAIGKPKGGAGKVTVGIDVALGDVIVIRGAQIKIQKTHKAAVVRMHITAPRAIPIEFTHPPQQRPAEDIPPPQTPPRPPPCPFRRAA